MLRAFLTFAFTALPGLAAAEGMGGAICRAGQGCSCFVVNDAGLFPVILGDTAAGQVALAENLVIDRSSNTTFRTRRSLSEVHRSFGGRGECPSDPEPEEIVPLDGLWQWRATGQRLTNCPMMLEAMIAAGSDEVPPVRIAWGGVFHPERLTQAMPDPEMRGGMGAYAWRLTGPNRWLSDNIRGQECEDGTCMEGSLLLAMSLVAPDRISGLMLMRQKVEGAGAAILAGLGMGDCTMRIRYDLHRISG
ncbi:hypothetical protein KY389_11585 [Paracoccus bogoriensis]|uniref:hypothetical protein n=1 Tax=Paracoccus bogoriensis TaxID=242065 RepID=UPI001CA55FB4|nr:hypothetical protein [Paracoccus bogoriensis]MBW7057327.1 hypothetical protein [Paracoccus bogoriensis]